MGAKGGALVERAVQILTKRGHHVTVLPTTGPGTACGIARQRIAAGADLVVAAGGDGTINEVAEGMVTSGVPLAILPAGTANVLATEMKLAPHVERAAESLDDWRPRRISVGHATCDGGRVARHFLLMAGIGLDAHIVYHVSGPLKARAGKLAYWVAAGGVLGRALPQLQAETDGQRHECSFALVTKVRNYGGDFEIAREVGLFDDQFEVVLFEGRSSLRYVKYFTGMVLHRLSGMEGVTVLRASRVALSSTSGQRVHVQIDGEYAGPLPAEIRIVPGALTLLVPSAYRPPEPAL